MSVIMAKCRAASILPDWSRQGDDKRLVVTLKTTTLPLLSKLSIAKVAGRYD